jgi:hypothetical protein
LTADLSDEEFSGATVGCSLIYFNTDDDISDVNNADNPGIAVE